MSKRVGLFGRYLDLAYSQMVEQRYDGQRACLEGDSDAILLDVGCKDGLNTRELSRAIGAERVIGLDYYDASLPRAYERAIDALRADANRRFPLTDACVDVVTAMDVIEHLVDPENCLREVHRVLKPGGYVVIATPNLASWHNVFALVIGHQPFSGPNVTSMLDSDVGFVRRLHRCAYDLDDGVEHIASDAPELHRHIVVLTLRALLSSLRRVGFDVERFRGYGYYPFSGALARGLSRIDPWHAHHVVVKARKPLTSR